MVLPEISGQGSESSEIRSTQSWRIESQRTQRSECGVRGLGDSEVRGFGDAQEDKTEDWSQGLKLTNWVRPNNEDEDEGKGNSRGTGRTMETRPETMEAGPETMETLGDDRDTWRRWRHSEMMETLGDDGDEAGDNLLMDRAVLGARVRWEPNLTEAVITQDFRDYFHFYSFLNGLLVYLSSTSFHLLSHFKDFQKHDSYSWC